MPPSISPQEFVAKWRYAALRERQAYQSHFNDLCRLVGHPTPVEFDPIGDRFCFEAGAAKTRGGQGWADVWFKGHFALEYKGKHADLKKAYEQLLQYRESLENPPLLIVSDIDTLEIHTNFTNTTHKVYPLTLDDLLTVAGQRTLRAVFYNPEELKAVQTTEEVTRTAAEKFARLAQVLYDNGEEPGAVAHFLIRLLFSLFAEDVGLLPEGLFTRLVSQTRRSPTVFASQLKTLFGQMSTGGWFGVEPIRFFDGRLFDDDRVLDLDTGGLDILASVSDLDWASIEPSIFGTLFERGLDPAKRSQLGAHYTSREDILLIVEPVLLAPLRRRWEEVQQEARDLAARRNDAGNASHRTRLNNQLSSLLLDFTAGLARVQVLDPACGSGNFLYVALRQLLDLWKEASVLAGELGLPLMSPLSGTAPSPDQLHGIEINPYAHQLAQATIWIGYIQWLRENGFGAPPDPILRPLDNILLMDAILAYGAAGRPVEPAWPPADVIIGNPPFLGDKKMRGELGDQYVEALRLLYEGRIPGQSDLVCYWFEKSRALIEANKSKRAGLLATNSIRTGANRITLERIKTTGDIFLAWSDRPWVLDGAAVRVSMVGFDKGEEKIKCLDGKQVPNISPDLKGDLDLTQARQLKENLGIAFVGVTKKGPFDIEKEVALEMLNSPINPNGKTNSKVIRKWVNASDLVRNPRDMWIVDFGDLSEEEASLYEKPYEYVKKHVKPFRDNVRNTRERTYWWLHGRSAPAFREAIKGIGRYIATPTVAKYRIFVWLAEDILPTHGISVFARSDDYFFGVLHSRIHEIWSLRKGNWMGAGNDPSYTPSTIFETFPFPWPPSHEPQDDPRVQVIAQAARELNEKREAWLNPPGASTAELQKRTLTNLYNRDPTWLQLAHQKLDRAVFAAYGWPADLTDEQILERLLALNLERST